MSMVYVVTEGSYSDYRIVAVFSTRKLAESFIKTAFPSGDASVEEYTLDKYVGAQWKESFEVVWHRDREPRRYMSKRVIANGERGEAGTGYGWSPVSFEHCEKMIVEARQAELRRKAVEPV